MLEDIRTYASWDRCSYASPSGSIEDFEPIPEFLECDPFVAQLATLALARHDNARRKVSNAHGRIACIDILAARTA